MREIVIDSVAVASPADTIVHYHVRLSESAPGTVCSSSKCQRFFAKIADFRENFVLLSMPETARPAAAQAPAPRLPDRRGLLFFDDFESGDYKGAKVGSWLGGGSGNVHVGPGGANGSRYALDLIHRGKPAGGQSSAEQRFRMAANATELWLEYDLFVPANFRHRGGGNNKFLVLWETTYGAPASAEVYLNFWPVNHPRNRPGNPGDSYLAITGKLPGSAANRPFGFVDRFFTAAERGRWNQFRMHVRLSSGPASNDGVIEIWWNGSKRLNAQRLPLPSGSAGRFFRNGYLLGWANSGYDQDTHFKIDNVRIYSSNPGW